MALEETTLNTGEPLPPDTTEVSLAKAGDAAPDANTQAESSTVKEDAKPKDFRSGISDVISKVTATSSVAEGEEKAKADPNAPVDKAKTDVALTPDQQAEADKALPFHNHPRWQQVMGENKAMTAKLAAQESVVSEFNQVTDFMKANDLQSNEVAELFRVGALLKNDPVAARDILHQVMTNLDTAIGEILPADLKAKVDDGTLDEAAAKEIARLRFQSTHSQQVNQRQLQKSQEQLNGEAETRRQQEHQQLVQSIQAGVVAWESQMKISDPDYALLQPQIEREVELSSIKNPPKTAAESVAQCQAAYDLVKKQMSGFGPKRRVVAPGPQQEQSSSTTVSEAPKSIAEIVNRGMGLT